VRGHEQTITKQLILTWDSHDLKRNSSATNNDIFILVLHTTVQYFFRFTVCILIHFYLNCYIICLYNFINYSLFYTLKVLVVITFYVSVRLTTNNVSQKWKYDAAAHGKQLKVKTKAGLKSYLPQCAKALCVPDREPQTAPTKSTCSSSPQWETQ